MTRPPPTSAASRSSSSCSSASSRSIVSGATLTAFGGVHARTTGRVERQQDNAEAARVALDGPPPAAQPRQPDGQRRSPRSTAPRTTTSSSRRRTPRRPGCATACRRPAAAPSDGDGCGRARARRRSRGRCGPCPGNGLDASDRVVSAGSPTRPAASTATSSTTSARRVAGHLPGPARSTRRSPTSAIELCVDSNVGDRVREMRVSTGVFLRNQNEPPTAAATSRPQGHATGRPQRLGARPTPRAARCEYFWFKGTAPTAADFAATAPPCRPAVVARA